jgi:hypothetical protein
MITTRAFIQRCIALGVDNPHAAARRLGVRHSLYRQWHGQRPVSARIERHLEAVEESQPVLPLTPDMARLLRTLPDVPQPRSNWEAGMDWSDVLVDLYDAGLAREGKLTPLGRHVREWLQERENGTDGGTRRR